MRRPIPRTSRTKSSIRKPRKPAAAKRTTKRTRKATPKRSSTTRKSVGAARRKAAPSSRTSASRKSSAAKSRRPARKTAVRKAAARKISVRKATTRKAPRIATGRTASGRRIVDAKPTKRRVPRGAAGRTKPKKTTTRPLRSRTLRSATKAAARPIQGKGASPARRPRATTPRKHPAVKRPISRPAKKIIARKPRPAPSPRRRAPVVASIRKPVPHPATTAIAIAAPAPFNDGIYRPSEAEPFMNERQLAYFRDKLTSWKSDILRESKSTLDNLQSEHIDHADEVDRASAQADRELELRARERQANLIRKIDQALTRIADGSYGYCEETGEPISLRRLEARPIATLSITAQEMHEKRERLTGTGIDFQMA